jgi:O-antigen/teichoic acid export membrane protein
MIMAGVCALVNIGLNLILIPLYSYAGAGVATIITELVLFILLFAISSKNIVRLPLHKIIVKPIIASGLMAIPIVLLPGINFIILIVLSMVIYFSFLYIIGGFTSEDKKMVMNLLKRNE